MKLLNFIIGCIFSASCLISLPTGVTASATTTKASISIVAFSASCLLSLPTAMASSKATKAKASPNNVVNSEYMLGLVSCPKHCASGANFGGILAAENVEECNPEDQDQRWLIHQEDDGGELIKFQSPTNGLCLGMAAHGGDDMLAGTTVLALPKLRDTDMLGVDNVAFYNVDQLKKTNPQSLSEQELLDEPGRNLIGTFLLLGETPPSGNSAILVWSSEGGEAVSLDQVMKVIRMVNSDARIVGDLAHYVDSSKRTFKLGVHVGVSIDGIASAPTQIYELESNIKKVAPGLAIPTVFFLGKPTPTGDHPVQDGYILTQYRLGGTSSIGIEPNEAEDSAGDHVLEGLSIPTSYSNSAVADVWGITGFQLLADPGGKYVASPLLVAIGEVQSFDWSNVDGVNYLTSAPSVNEDTCNGQLALVDCQDPTASWLFSGTQLISAACWISGHSAAMAVNEDCTSLELSLASNGAPSSITRAQSFMFLEPSFIETIPEGPTPSPTPPRPTPQPTPPPTFIVTFGSTPTVSTETT